MANLSYLFTCRFTDGTTIQQTQDDVSSEDATRSAFFDVVQRLEDVQTFVIKDSEHTYMVDLRDGHFEIDGVPFEVSTEELPGEAMFRLIYFHRHQHNVVQGQALTGDGAVIRYHVGWQTTIGGKNFQSVISAG